MIRPRLQQPGAFVHINPEIQVDMPTRGSDHLHAYTQVENWLIHTFPCVLNRLHRAQLTYVTNYIFKYYLYYTSSKKKNNNTSAGKFWPIQMHIVTVSLVNNAVSVVHV